MRMYSYQLRNIPHPRPALHSHADHHQPVCLLHCIASPSRTDPRRSTITTPHKLETFAPSAALRVLLSPAERAQPLRLYLAPGVALAVVLEGLVVPTLNLLYQLVGAPLFISHRYPALAAALTVVLVNTVLLTPLKVMTTRLTIQRQGDAPDVPAMDAPPAYEEVVLEIRGTQEASYTGLLDCGAQIVREEGWRVLFRAWWITALAMSLAILAQLTA